MYYQNNYDYQRYGYNQNNTAFQQFPQYPQSEVIGHQTSKQPMYPHLKQSTLNAVASFVNYGLQEAKGTSYKHALTEVAAMTYLMGKGMDPQTAYLTVESWEVNESF